jgi:hypothetical protein
MLMSSILNAQLCNKLIALRNKTSGYIQTLTSIYNGAIRLLQGALATGDKVLVEVIVREVKYTFSGDFAGDQKPMEMVTLGNRTLMQDSSMEVKVVTAEILSFTIIRYVDAELNDGVRVMKMQLDESCPMTKLAFNTCPVGTGGDQCQDCPAGYFSPGASVAQFKPQCTVCDEHTYSSQKQGACSECVEDKSEVAARPACLTCPSAVVVSPLP